MKNPMILLYLLIVFLIITGCELTENEKPQAFHDSEILHVMADEAVVKISNQGTSGKISISLNDLYQDTLLIQSSDTTIYIKDLSPSTEYTFTTQVLSQAASTPVKRNFITLDSTSHDVTWLQDISLGSTISSFARKPQIISDDYIIISGHYNIYDDNDSLKKYYFVKWDGNELNPFNIQTYNEWGYLYNLEARDFIAFDSTDIWIAHGNVTRYVNGYSQTHFLRSLRGSPSLLGEGESIERIWGLDSKNIYGAGKGGTLVHYNGQKWTRIELGTNGFITNISGYYDEITNETVVICSEGSLSLVMDNVLYILRNNKLIKRLSFDINESLYSIWIESPYRFYIGGKNLKVFSGYEYEEIDLFSGIGNILGIAANNFFVVRGTGILSHYNGSTWHHIYDFEPGYTPFYGAQIKGKTIAISGISEEGKARIIIGRQY